MATQSQTVYKEGNLSSSLHPNHVVSSYWEDQNNSSTTSISTNSTNNMPPTSTLPPTQPPPSTSVPPPPPPTSLRQPPPPLQDKPRGSPPFNGVDEPKNGGFPDSKWNIDEKEAVKRRIYELKRTFHNGRYLIVRHLPKDTTEQVMLVLVQQ